MHVKQYTVNLKDNPFSTNNAVLKCMFVQFQALLLIPQGPVEAQRFLYTVRGLSLHIKIACGPAEVTRPLIQYGHGGSHIVSTKDRLEKMVLA